MRSDALAQLEKWLSQSLQDESPAHTLLLLELLGHLPISVQSLQASGVGKTVNKMRKSEHAGVQQASAKLTTSWKEMVAFAKPPAGAEHAATLAHAQKRTAADGGDGDSKRLRSANSTPAGGVHQPEEDGSLDSVLSAQAQPRKASLKPDHLRARRPAQMLSSNIPNRRSALQNTVELPSPSLPSPLPMKRVKWAAGDKLVEMREYVVDSKRSSAQVVLSPHSTDAHTACAHSVRILRPIRRAPAKRATYVRFRSVAVRQSVQGMVML